MTMSLMHRVRVLGTQLDDLLATHPLLAALERQYHVPKVRRVCACRSWALGWRV
jgi:hypothetical protein